MTFVQFIAFSFGHRIMNGLRFSHNCRPFQYCISTCACLNCRFVSHWTSVWCLLTLVCYGLQGRTGITESYSDYATDWATDKSCAIFGRGRKFFSSSRRALGRTQQPVQWALEAFSAEVKQQGRVADHSPPVSGKVKNEWSYTSIPPMSLWHAHDKFTFTFTVLPLMMLIAFLCDTVWNMLPPSSASKLIA